MGPLSSAGNICLFLDLSANDVHLKTWKRAFQVCSCGSIFCNINGQNKKDLYTTSQITMKY